MGSSRTSNSVQRGSSEPPCSEASGLAQGSQHQVGSHHSQVVAVVGSHHNQVAVVGSQRVDSQMVVVRSLWVDSQMVVVVVVVVVVGQQVDSQLVEVLCMWAEKSPKNAN